MMRIVILTIRGTVSTINGFETKTVAFATMDVRLPTSFILAFSLYPIFPLCRPAIVQGDVKA